MFPSYTCLQMLFEWDEDKNKKNIEKYGVSFQTASLVFSDSNRVELLDEAHTTLEEERFVTIGMVNNVLSVVFTERKDKTRIISARKANKKELRTYYGNRNV